MIDAFLPLREEGNKEKFVCTCARMAGRKGWEKFIVDACYENTSYQIYILH